MRCKSLMLWVSVGLVTCIARRIHRIDSGQSVRKWKRRDKEQTNLDRSARSEGMTDSNRYLESEDSRNVKRVHT